MDMDTKMYIDFNRLLNSNFTFEFHVDFMGEVELIYFSENTKKTTSEINQTYEDYETIVDYFVDSNIIPVNERTEGTISFNNRRVEITYRTCTSVGGDWEEDVWEEGYQEVFYHF